MIKKELKTARAFFGADLPVDCAIPVSLSMLAPDAAQHVIPDEPREPMQRMKEALTLVFDLEDLEPLHGYGNLALCLKGLQGACGVFVDGVLVAEWDSAPARALFVLKHKPSFSVEIRFPQRDVPMDVGILGGAELIAFSHDLISDVYTEQSHKNEKCELFVRVRTLCFKESEAFATLYSPSGEMHYLGFVNGEGHITLPEAQRFLPVSEGRAGLYRLVVTLYHDGVSADTYETYIGFRKLSFSKDAPDVPFAMTLDDAPFFVKAACVNAHPALRAAQSLEAFANALPAFVKAGGNALFATAESGFLREEVYDLCDRLGIFVFQQLPEPPSDAEAIHTYFAQLKSALLPLANHPSLALIALPEGVDPSSELARSIKGFFAFAFPLLPVRKLPALGFASISHLPSMPSPLSIRRFLPMDARRIFSYTMESAQDSEMQLVSMLGEAAKEFPYGASLSDICYITALSSAEAADAELAKALAQGVPGGILAGRLFEGGISMKPSLMDALLQKKATYYDLEKTFSPLFLHVEASGERVEILLASRETEERSVRVVTALLDRFNHRILSMADECILQSGMPMRLEKSIPEIASHEREYYVLVSIYEGSVPILEKTALFVPAKHFRFAYPGICCEIKGGGRNYEITLSASAYVRRLQLSFSKTAATFEKNYFDITSDAKILIPLETETVTTSSLLENQLRLRSLYDVGRITEQDLSDEKDLEA